MTKIYKILTSLFLIVLSSFTFLFYQNWEIVAGYTIRFDGKYAHGTFSNLGGIIRFDPESPESGQIDVTVDAASIETGNNLKNKHAKGDKWFDTEQFPLIRFTSSAITKRDSSFVVHGMLDLHGVKKEIAIPFSFQQKQNAFYFSGKFKVNRPDFGIGKSSGGESDSTTVEVSVPVTAR
jgi:polyisoprenoid-binding protein YceI